MNNFTFENQGTNTFLVYEVAPTNMLDSMSLGMLTNNKIDGLATTLFMQMDTTKYIKYNVSAKISVRQFFAGPVNKKRLIGVFKGIVDAMLSAEEYMIDPNTILLDLDYIFADVSTCETVLVCLPIMNQESNNVDLGTFFKNIVFSTQFDQTENCDYVAKIINYLNSTPVFSLTDFDEVLKDIERNGSGGQTVSVQQNVQQSVAMQSVVPQSTVHEIKKQPVSQPQVQQVVQPKQQPVQQQAVQPKQQPVTPQNQSFAVPGQKPVQNNQVQNQNRQTAQAVDDGKKMSMFYLLQHYNKENAAAYKAQKEAQKAGKKAGSAPKNMGMVMPGAQAPKTPVQPQNMGMAIPGQKPQPQQGFAIPGQKPQPQQGFAIPGQPAQSPMGAGQPNKPAQPQKVTPVTPAQPVQPTPVQPIQAPVQQATPVQTAPQGQPMNFGETTVLNAGTFGETTVLNAGMMQQEVKAQPYLIRSKNNEKIELNKPVFRIGKEKSYVDYFISDNTAISRSHANVISRDGEYFVVDTNSTNHTYINGMMIQSNVETKITDGAKIRLANEEFEFKLM